MKLEIELDVPEGLIDPETKQEILAGWREDVILRLFGEEKIPGGLAARLLGLTRAQFMELTRRRSVPYIVSDADGIEREVQAIEDYRKRHLTPPSG